MTAVDCGGGGLVFLGADQLHLGVGDAVEVEQGVDGAGDGGEGCRCHAAFFDIVDALDEGVDDVTVAFGQAFVGAGGGG